mgnify:CR=1 FL=1
MKILIIVTKGGVGGAQVSVLNLARSLSVRGEKVAVGFGGGEFLEVKLAENRIPFHIFNNLKRTHNPFRNLFFIFEIFFFLKKNKFDVAHFNSSNALFGAVGAKMAGVRTVFTFRGLSMLDENYQASSLLKKIYYYFFKLLCFFVDEPVFVSEKNRVRAINIGVIKNGTTIYNGLERSNLIFASRKEARTELEKLTGSQLSGCYIIGSIGRLAYPKNYEFLIRMLPEILKIKPDAKAVIVGGGPEESRYESLISELGLVDRILLAGEIHDAYRFIKAFELFVLPSAFEGLSITLIEALFAGVPVLAANVGGNSELLSEEQLYKVNDKEDFLEKINKIISDEKLAFELAERNLEKSKNFELERTAGKYLEICKSKL